MRKGERRLNADWRPRYMGAPRPEPDTIVLGECPEPFCYCQSYMDGPECKRHRELAQYVAVSEMRLKVDSIMLPTEAESWVGVAS
jgi:hypothetical protein